MREFMPEVCNSMPMKKIIMFAWLMVFGTLLCGCPMKETASPAMAYYWLDYEPPILAPQPRLPVTLSIEKFDIAPPYDTTQIIYGKNPYTRNKYHYHQWMVPPEERISHLLARDLIASQRFQAVLFSAHIPTNYQLGGMIHEIYEQDAEKQWKAILSMTLTLIRNDKKDVHQQFCFQKNYQSTCPLDQNNPKGLSQALSMALSELSGKIIRDIYETLR